MINLAYLAVLPLFYYSIWKTWIAIEVLFYFNFLYEKHRLQKVIRPPVLSKAERERLYWSCLDTIENVTEWAEGWFYYKKDYSHPTLNEIKRDNLALWFAWAFWHDHLDNVIQNNEIRKEIDWMISTAEDHFNFKLPTGFNSELECIRLNLDPIEGYYRPLMVYIALYSITALFNLFYLRLYWNFKHSVHVMQGACWGGIVGLFHDFVQYIKRFNNTNELGHVSYYYKAGKENKTPIVFIHGIGAGVISYVEFLHRLILQDIDRPIFLVELPYVSMHMVDQVPTANRTVVEIEAMLNLYGYKQAIFMSHSLGTGVTSWIMNLNPKLISGLVMIDPICFLLHYHHVAFNFVYRIPKSAIDYIMHYGVAKELYTSYYISRHFQWFETIYFIQQNMSRNAVIFLSEMDNIVSCRHVNAYLVKNNVKSVVMNNLEHAMFLTSEEWKSKILKQLDQITFQADINNKE